MTPFLLSIIQKGDGTTSVVRRFQRIFSTPVNFRPGKHSSYWLLLCAVLIALSGAAQTSPTVRVTIMAGGQADPNVRQYVASPNFVPVLQLNGFYPTFVVVRGSIERLSPAPFKISVGQLVDSLPILLAPAQPTQMNSPSQKLSAFNYFELQNLQVTGIDPALLLNDPSNPTSPNNYINLPDGMYRVCFKVNEVDGGRDITDPSSMCATFNINCRPPDVAKLVTTIPALPAGGLNPLMAQNIAAGLLSTTLRFDNPGQFCQQPQVKIFGKIERLSPSPFTLATRPDYIPQSTAAWNQAPRLLTPAEQLDALGNLDENNLVTTGIDPAALRDPNNPAILRLPDGNYRICFYARYFRAGQVGGDASNVNLSCAMFTVCTRPATAPQLTQPVNSINVSSAYPSITPSSPVVFTWTPPQSICGTPRSGFLYDLELRELLENQTVLDVTNNPFVFQKTRLPSTTFLLDTNLYRNVLQRGKRYAVRVKAYATAPLDTFAVDNEGYSRVEAFQFGNVPDAVVRPVGVFTIDQPENYYIPFGERKTNQWDDAYTALQRGAKRDTIIPIEEYIALNLIQNGIAYNPDAIELFLTLNPELASLKNLRLSTPARLPEFPPIGVDEEKRFAKEMATSLSPDPAANKTFRRYLDSLHSATLVLPGSNALAAGMATVVASLTDFEKRVDNTDRVSVTLLNQLLAEMVYTLRQSDGAGNPKDEDHLANVMQTMRDLLANESNSTSLLFPLPPGGAAPVTSLLPSVQLSLAGTLLVHSGTNSNWAEQGPLVPMDVIVWSGATAPPARAVLIEPKKNGNYQIFYTTPVLYNHKNPEINAQQVLGLASTARVSLPKLARFKFWTLNMLNHKLTKAVDVETSDVFLLNDKKNWPGSKRLHVVLKVD